LLQPFLQVSAATGRLVEEGRQLLGGRNKRSCWRIQG
jgi:hypothetical protein